MSDKLDNLRAKLKDRLETAMKNNLSFHGSRDLIEELIDMRFFGCKGVDNMTDKELLSCFEDELCPYFDVDKENNYDDDSEEAVEVRNLAKEFEVELVAEKELLGEEV